MRANFTHILEGYFTGVGVIMQYDSEATLKNMGRYVAGTM